MQNKKHHNTGLIEVGKGLITLANLFLILFFLNNYLQQDYFGIIGTVASLYIVIMLYISGYTMINKGDSLCQNS